MADPTVRELLIRQQQTLQTELGMSDALGHPGEKGDNSELNWIKAITTFLPERYRVAKGQVLDSEDNVSDVIDAIIFDRQYCPLWFSVGDSQYVPAESVYGVFEAKQDLSKEHVEYASEKAASVRKLHRTNGGFMHSGGAENNPRPPLRIVAGILTTISTWSPMFGAPFEKALLNCTGDGEIDLGCALRDGAFDITARTTDDIDIARSTPEAALMFFLMRLYSRLQLLGTVPAVDMSAYAEALQED